MAIFVYPKDPSIRRMWQFVPSLLIFLQLAIGSHEFFMIFFKLCVSTIVFEWDFPTLCQHRRHGWLYLYMRANVIVTWSLLGRERTLGMRMQRYIQSASLHPGTHSFSFWTHRMWNKGSNWTQKKNRMFMQITNARKNMRTAYFRRKLNIPISHNGEMFGFL